MARLRSCAVLAVAGLALLTASSAAQDSKWPAKQPAKDPQAKEEKPDDTSPLGGEHTSRDPRKCKKCAPALSKAISYLNGKGAGGFVQSYMLAWLGLVDPQFSSHTSKAIQSASQARAAGFNGNWFIAIPAIFLAGAYYRYRQGAGGMQHIAADAQRNQHHTGGWHHNKSFNMKGYSEDLGILTAMIFGMFMTMKGAGIGVPKDMVERAEKNLEGIMGPTGIGYGTGKGHWDAAGSRGAYAFMGLHFGGQTDHPFYEKLKSAVKSQIPRVDKGHAVGCLHFLSMSIACYLAGYYDEFAREWIDRLIGKQNADGSILLGDDGVGGGEEKNIGGRVGSTAVFAIILLLQKPGAFDPPKKPQPAQAKKDGRPGGGSPWKRRQPEEEKVPTPGGNK